MTHQETFIQIYQEHIHRRGADQLLAWLQSDASDFSPLHPVPVTTALMKAVWLNIA